MMWKGVRWDMKLQVGNHGQMLEKENKQILNFGETIGMKEEAQRSSIVARFRQRLESRRKESGGKESELPNNLQQKFLAHNWLQSPMAR